MAVTGDSFGLSPQEDFLFGVRLQDDVLSFGPSGGVVAMSAVAGVVMGGIGLVLMLSSSGGGTINGYEVKHSEALVLLGIFFLLYAIGFVVSSLRVGVSANGEGVEVRHLMQRRRLPWEAIAAVRVGETRARRWRSFWGPNEFQLRLKPVASWSIGLVELTDGTRVRLPSFRCASREDGLSMGSTTATEVKAQALARYMRHATGRSVEPVEALSSPIEDTVDPWSVWAFVGSVAAAIALWLVVSWAAGRIVSPAFLVIGLVVGLYQWSWHRQAG